MSTYVSCVLETSNGKSLVNGSYSFTLGDKGVLVQHVVGGKGTPVFSKAQQAMSAAAVHPAGKHTGGLTMQLNAELLVGGTHVTIASAKNAENEPGIVAVIPDANGNPLSGTYIAGISPKRLVVSQWKSGKATLGFSKLQP